MAGFQLRTDAEWRRSHQVTVATIAIALLAWLVLVFHHELEHLLLGEHAAMAMEATAPGVFEATARADGVMGVLHYLGMWGTMMVAMMYPSTAGAFQWYADHVAQRSTTAAVLSFVGAYTLLWVLIGLVPLAVTAVIPIDRLAQAWGSLYFGLALLAVGTFQLSPLKRRYLGRCRTPVAVLGTDPPAGVREAVRAGTMFGRQEVGACGVLMGLMVLVGSMNIPWMVAITGVLSLERLSDHGQRWARAVGLLAVVGGLGLVTAGLAGLV